MFCSGPWHLTVSQQVNECPHPGYLLLHTTTPPPNFSSLKQDLIITVPSLAIELIIGMVLSWGLCAVAVNCGWPFLKSPLGGEPRLVLTCDWQAVLTDGWAVVVGCNATSRLCCLSDLKQLPGSFTALPFGTLIKAPMESSQL